MKRLNSLIGTLLATAVIAGCSSRIQQPLLQPDFNTTGINNSQASSDNAAKRAGYTKQDISTEMDEFSTIQKQGMK